MTTEGRLEAAAKALGEFWDNTDHDWPVTDERETTVVIEAADAHDLAHGVARLRVDEEAVERAARAMYETDPLALYDEDAKEFVEGGRPWEWLSDDTKEWRRTKVRAVIDALKEEA